MVIVKVHAKVQGHTAQEAFNRLSDLSLYPEAVAAVHSIVVGEENGVPVSTWEVDFHGGIMRWKEEDINLPEELTMRFRQLEGDVDHFTGEWKITDGDKGCLIDFQAEFDLGVAGLSEVLEPIADAALRENVRGIVTALLGEAEFDG